MIIQFCSLEKPFAAVIFLANVNFLSTGAHGNNYFTHIAKFYFAK